MTTRHGTHSTKAASGGTGRVAGAAGWADQVARPGGAAGGQAGARPGQGHGSARRSPGSVYPALQQLEDEGLVQTETPEGGRRQYTLTAEGREYVTAHPDEVRAPWEMVARSVGADAIELRHLVAQVAAAAVQVVRVGDDAQAAKAQQILTDARRSLYRVLAADDTGDMS